MSLKYIAGKWKNIKTVTIGKMEYTVQKKKKDTVYKIVVRRIDNSPYGYGSSTLDSVDFISAEKYEQMCKTGIFKQ